MNKKTLTTAVLAGLTGIAGIVSVSNAVHINPDGTGQVLIYPYYTTRDDNATLISVVNTTSAVKAVKVRFIEGENSREVLDFNLYLSPFDVWTAAITDLGGNPLTPGITVRDNSCTVPQIFNPATGMGSQAFIPSLFPSDSGRNSVDRAREGYVELLEMGNIAPTTKLGANAVHTTALVDANGDPMPLDCDALIAAWRVGGAWANNASTDFSDGLTGGLFGDAVVVRVAGARAIGYDPTALEAFNTVNANLHTSPGSLSPDLTGSAAPSVSNVVLNAGVPTPVLVTDATWVASFQAVSAVFMVDQIMNQYAVEASLNGGTEWVVTMPTKNRHVWPSSLGSAIPPFTDLFDEATPKGDGVACESFIFNFWDRNEQTITPETPPLDFSPAPIITGDNPEFCYEVNVLTFDNSVASAGAVGNEAGGITSDILGSRLFTDVPVAALGFESGWGSINFNGLGADTNGDGVADPVTHVMSSGANDYFGLPVVGFAVRTADNSAINALFGAAFEHKYARVITPAPQ